MKNIVFRVSASPQVGIGHFMRCLTLARMLSALKVRIHFICNKDLSKKFVGILQEEGFSLSLSGLAAESVFHIEQDADLVISTLKGQRPEWLVIDHYGIDANWERKLRPYVGKILVIDDLANRPHDCDILLDQNLYPHLELRYKGLIASETRTLLGPSYVLLRPEFYKQNESQVRSTIKKVIVNFGGSDPTGETVKLLEALKFGTDALKGTCFNIVAGPSNSRREEIRLMCEKVENAFYYEQIALEELLGDTDLAIGAGGISMWERCFMGVPAGVIIVAENQVEAVAEAESQGLIWNLGRSEEVSKESLLEFLCDRLQHPEKNVQMSHKCLQFMHELREQKEHPVVTIIREEL
ncbi:UDP-2,4-diacetamido-2,4,6-trideoxy-beta-L-altropyranose hydrolase [Saccharibacillus kuerlensis]|uniref:UDP-2,4-diacetamido-2,4, 6-trideoxy-beta-L-altropyranose hydrolase n=1 Tax=Saccharibacillus kuerlensis TaxID=459527 RepID=A0ABQ2KUY0_9BACL|nr:UDP-2,4-diacetamido-2,4,6-trideoxy-beta-L-altropyranose hydrolase [Saccharibacillus kuerlensis]GGN93192.1 UDP-2,4-diacetamido-2,4,6-trideoxy-beta-L-altropyranose hydrolase [Saccharibacillus kuerlensis]